MEAIDMLNAVTELLNVISGNHFAVIALIALAAVIKRPPPKE